MNPNLNSRSTIKMNVNKKPKSKAKNSNKNDYIEMNQIQKLEEYIFKKDLHYKNPSIQATRKF